MFHWSLKVAQGFCHAFNGIAWALRTQRNLQIHLAATLLVITLGLITNLAAWKWCCLAICTSLVWMAELFNTTLEVMCDRITTEKDEHIRRAKDVAAGAVLVTATLAIFIAFMIFF